MPGLWRFWPQAEIDLLAANLRDWGSCGHVMTNCRVSSVAERGVLLDPIANLLDWLLRTRPKSDRQPLVLGLVPRLAESHTQCRQELELIPNQRCRQKIGVERPTYSATTPTAWDWPDKNVECREKRASE